VTSVPVASVTSPWGTRALALALMLGAALLGVGAVMHPVLTGEAAHDLEIMASTPAWRAVHLVMLTGSGLVIAGIWVRVVTPRSTNGLLVASLAIVSVGLALNALNIAYMAGTGTHLAEMFRAGRAEAAPMFDVTHPIGLMAARFGNFLVALGAITLGWAERDDVSRPRWIAWLAWSAAIGGLAGVLLFHETSRMILAAVSLLSAWQVATAVLALRATKTIS
jgi:hypothetical protein